MKKFRIISLVAALALVFTAFSCTVFATEVSTTDVSSSDVTSATDYISDFELTELKIDAHRFSMLVPSLDGSFSANSTNSELAAAIPGYNVESIINYNDTYYSGNIISYLFSGTTESSNVMLNVLYTTNNYTKFIGDYSDVDQAVLDDLCASTYSYSGKFPEILNINGNTFLYSEGYDSEYGYYSYTLETIVGGGRYQFYIDLTNPSPADKAIVDNIVNSIKIGGFRATLTGAADKNLVTILLIAVIVLAVIVCLLTFFVIRFSLFSNAAGSKFNIIGFNMPPSKKELEELRKKQAKKGQSKKNNSGSSIVDSISDID